MEHHGYGRKTFEVFTEPNGRVAVERLTLPRSLETYEEFGADLPFRDILDWKSSRPSQLERTLNLYCVPMSTVPGTECGAGAGGATDGNAWVFGRNVKCGTWDVIAHELGHGFGL